MPARRARVALRHGRLAEAQRWAASTDLSVDTEPTYLREYELVTVAKVLAAGGRPAGRSAGPGFLARWIAVVTRHRVVTVLATVLALCVVSVPITSMATTLVPSPEPGSTQDRAQALLAEGFGEGGGGVTRVLIEAGDGG